LTTIMRGCREPSRARAAMCQADFQRLRFISKSRIRTGPNKRQIETCLDENLVILIHITLVRRRFAQGRPEGRIARFPTDPRPLLQLSKSIRLRRHPQLSAGDGGELRTVSEARSPSSGQQSFFGKLVRILANVLRMPVNHDKQ
jgi:hypothetical protein